MAYKRGQTETPSFTLGLIISLLILLALGIIGYQIAQKNIDVRARVAFSDFLHYYANCTSYGATDCYCEPLDLSVIPESYTLQAVDVEGDFLRFELFKEGRMLQSTEVQGKELCTYSYSFLYRNFSLEPVPAHELHKQEYLLDAALVLQEGHTCFVTRARDGLPLFVDQQPTVASTLKALYEHKVSCSSRSASPLFDIVVFLQTIDDGSYQPLFDVYPHPLLHPLKNQLEQRLISFVRVASSLSDLDSVNRHVTLSRILPDQHFSEQSILLSLSYHEGDKDHIILRYLENSSSSKSLAEFIQSSLVPAYDVTLVPFADEPLGGLFGNLHEEYFILEKGSDIYLQRHEFPAVFIDVIDDGKAPSILPQQIDSLVESFALGVRSFLFSRQPEQS